MSLTVHNIPKTKIKDLLFDILIESSILAVIDVKTLLTPNPNITYFQVMKRLIMTALDNHEKTCPLFKRSRIFISDNSYTFVDNFNLFLDCKLDEALTTLVPKSSPYALDTSVLHVRRAWKYDKPVLNDVYNLGSVNVDYIASYPYVMNEDKKENDFTDDSYIYYMDRLNGKTQDKIFRRQVYLQILGYIKGLKNNLRYPDIPFDMLPGVEEEYQVVQQELQEFYRKNSSHSKLFR